MKTIIILLAMLCSFKVQAGLKMKLNADNSLFLCNVGVGQKSKSVMVCLDPEGNACTEGSDSCICHSTDAGSISSTLNVVDQDGNSFIKSIYASGGQQSTTFSQAESWRNRIEGLDFKFSSDYYLSDYFLDFCYLGPQAVIDQSTGVPVDSSEGNYIANVMLAYKDATSGSVLYGAESGLMVQYQIVCDLRKDGLSVDPRGPSENNPSTGLEVDFVNGSSSSLASGGSLFTSPINDWTDQVPRFCVLRTWFHETNENRRRVNSLSVSDFTLDINIENGIALEVK